MAKNRFAILLEEHSTIITTPAPEVAEVIISREIVPPEPVHSELAAPEQPVRVGKRSDPNYRQISTYVRAELYKAVKKRLTDEERDFSDLLDQLLVRWISP
jgi:hypothetical protein